MLLQSAAVTHEQMKRLLPIPGSIDGILFFSPRFRRTIGEERSEATMKLEKKTAILAALTLILWVCYLGSTLSGSGQAAETEDTLSTEPSTTREREEPSTTSLPEITTASEDADADLPERLAETMAGMDGSCIFVYDAGENQLLCCNTAASEKIYPASITKLYTAWLALSYLSPETIITVGDELALVGRGSSLAYLSRGCRLRVEMLVEALLLPSGNDAAYVLAAAAGRVMAGDERLSSQAAVQRFVWEMNQEAERLGFVNSHFSNPDGYHAGAHYSCPADIAQIGALAMENPTILKYTAMEADAVTFASGQTITWYNTNRLINKGTAQYCADAVGLKTGHTDASGYCLLAAFVRGEEKILVGIFGAEKNYPRYENALRLWQCFAPEE